MQHIETYLATTMKHTCRTLVTRYNLIGVLISVGKMQLFVNKFPIRKILICQNFPVKKKINTRVFLSQKRSKCDFGQQFSGDLRSKFHSHEFGKREIPCSRDMSSSLVWGTSSTCIIFYKIESHNLHIPITICITF